MAKVLVYYFRKYDIMSDEFHRSKRRATLETVSRVRGEPLKETVIEIDEAELDSEGFQRKKN